ncbi:hypothetical protein JCM4914_02020 [Streptomyces platensis subsp. malvinus]
MPLSSSTTSTRVSSATPVSLVLMPDARPPGGELSRPSPTPSLLLAPLATAGPFVPGPRCSDRLRPGAHVGHEGTGRLKPTPAGRFLGPPAAMGFRQGEALGAAGSAPPGRRRRAFHR